MNSDYVFCREKSCISLFIAFGWYHVFSTVVASFVVDDSTRLAQLRASENEVVCLGTRTGKALELSPEDCLGKSRKQKPLPHNKKTPLSKATESFGVFLSYPYTFFDSAENFTDKIIK